MKVITNTNETLRRRKATKLYNVCLEQAAQRWRAIGARVSYSFYETPQVFTKEAIITGLKELGVDYHAIPKQTKWFEFWKNEGELRLEAAIDKIKL